MLEVVEVEMEQWWLGSVSGSIGGRDGGGEGGGGRDGAGGGAGSGYGLLLEAVEVEQEMVKISLWKQWRWKLR